MGVIGGSRGGNGGNSGNGEACGSNERYRGKNNKMKTLDQQVVVAAETNTGQKEGATVGNSNATEGAPEAGPWGA